MGVGKKRTRERGGKESKWEKEEEEVGWGQERMSREKNEERYGKCHFDGAQMHKKADEKEEWKLTSLILEHRQQELDPHMSSPHWCKLRQS